MITFKVRGSFKNTEMFLQHASKLNIRAILQSCGEMGVAALALATPIDTGLSANSWSYFTYVKNGIYGLAWTNTDIENGFNVIIALQYGHATRSGGYVLGRDFINPAIKPVFDHISERVWKAVTSL